MSGSDSIAGGIICLNRSSIHFPGAYMCLAIPMQIIESDGQTACCISSGGIRREVSLYLLSPGSVAPGDFVIVHVGYAIQKIVSCEAQTTWQLLGEMHESETSRHDA
jgi:hydrogenase expression/formation protein HypC